MLACVKGRAEAASCRSWLARSGSATAAAPPSARLGTGSDHAEGTGEAEGQAAGADGPRLGHGLPLPDWWPLPLRCSSATAWRGAVVSALFPPAGLTSCCHQLVGRWLLLLLLCGGSTCCQSSPASVDQEENVGDVDAWSGGESVMAFHWSPRLFTAGVAVADQLGGLVAATTGCRTLKYCSFS